MGKITYLCGFTVFMDEAVKESLGVGAYLLNRSEELRQVAPVLRFDLELEEMEAINDE